MIAFPVDRCKIVSTASAVRPGTVYSRHNCPNVANGWSLELLYRCKQRASRNHG